MSSECQTDTIILLESICKLKLIIIKSIGINNIKKNLIEKYEKIMKNISLEEHVQMLTGLKFFEESSIYKKDLH